MTLSELELSSNFRKLARLQNGIKFQTGEKKSYEKLLNIMSKHLYSSKIRLPSIYK